MPTVTTFEALLSGLSWNGIGTSTRPVFLTFSFEATAPLDYTGVVNGDVLATFRPFGSAEQATAREALKAWAEVSGITFFEVPSGQGDLRFGLYDFAAGGPDFASLAGFAYNPFVLDSPDGAFEDPIGGDVFIDFGHATLDVLLHEVGHALGLKHPFEGNVTLETALDTTANTVMSYTGPPPSVLGPMDLAAIRQLYGGQELDGTQAASWSWSAETHTLTQAGSAGADILAGVGSRDRISAGGGDDYVMARGGDDSLDGGEGADTMAGGDGNDTAVGGLGMDIIDGDNGADSLTGGEGDDELYGLAGNDTLDGGDGDDYLSAGSGANRLLGGAGNDIFFVRAGLDQVEGGDGFDELWLAPTSSASVSLSYSDLTSGGGTWSGIEIIVLFGNVNADTLNGGALIDQLVGDAGADSLVGAAADDELFGGSGNDTLSGGDGADFLSGGSGDDILTPGAGADDIRGGSGEDTVDYGAELEGVTATLNAARDVFGGSEAMFEIEHAIGTAFADRITGDGGSNRLFGGGGGDTVSGGEGSNYLRGDDGADSLLGGGGFDDINGNMGDDTASGGLGDDWVVGGRDNDRLFGDDGGDLVYGNLGADTCEGGAGADTLRGGQQDDVLRGGDGADFLSGDRDADTLTGGAGADTFSTFAEAGVDRVTDFNAAEGDRVMLAAGTVYTTAQVGADTVITMTGGGQMVLVGVTLSSLPSGWILGA